MDLVKLGEELRARRKALGIPRAELARRVGVTPTYIWLIENARPRKGGEPSRPSQEVLLRWARTLGIDERYTRRTLAMAGYAPASPEDQRQPEPFQANAVRMAAMGPMSAQDTGALMAYPPMASRIASMASPHSPDPAADEVLLLSAAPVSFPQPPEMRRDGLLQRAREVLDTAEESGRGDEAADLLQSFLDWLRYRMQKADHA